ncbi:NADH-quinone oxidoreductase subunit NuoG [Pontibacter cellulosilyticus]|uniref:NADH-quinone oxidoreductase subunit G n=1 Tax=Pontibacter cellulosilyticus TaxID=1720253 RepID=A0A923N4J9_9BACT|nr:NADH-quinone oxidoreductase subunit NuoG [Pontibacter cellulosilyticus]MBC5992044.1 NADH-quinone oxidoreductase subunit NuoG [Pontibacter cellulosilyticus]
MATIYIDDKPFEVPEGKNLLETCLNLKEDLPYFCWHPAMGSVGACRQCAVTVYKDENDKVGRLMMSCMEPVRDGMRLSIKNQQAKDFRNNVIGWLMTNHPHDCAVCDEGGSCHLQDMTVMTGHTYRKYSFDKKTYRNQYLGPFLNHEMNRCIQCYRCVRYYKDYAGGKDLDVFGAHNHLYFGRAEEGVLESEFSGNLAEVCPTGVFTDKTLKQHYTRKWDLTTAPSVCHHCSLGCNTIAGERYGTLRNITTRYNGEVNGYFLCDRGRFGYEFVNSAARIRKPLVRSQLPEATTKEHALQEAAGMISKGRVIGIGSPRASVESNFVLKTLVGEDNFYLGVSEPDHDLVEFNLRVLRETKAHILSLREVEKCDAVLILGEDLTNTAPMLALAVRQSVRQQPLEEVAALKIPLWQDAAARELIQDKKGPLYIATFNPTKLDEVATEIFNATPAEIARLGFAIANKITGQPSEVNDLGKAEEDLAAQIAEALLLAKRPAIISGTHGGRESIIKAAANIANALHDKGKEAGIMLTAPECNSMGLDMLGSHRLESAFAVMEHGEADTVIILENDLYRRACSDEVNKFFEQCKNVIVLDHLHTPTTERANVLLSAGTFAESDGTLVNNEGRAQRFYQVYPTSEDLQESWRWLMQLGAAIEHKQMLGWSTFDDILPAIVVAHPELKGIERVTPSADFRIAGQKIPRETHRFSGRTSMNAGMNVSEPKPQEDPDSPLTFTMEGYRGQAPSSIIPFFWSPGWNSQQAINKYQEEIGGPLHGGDPGIRMIEKTEQSIGTHFSEAPEHFQPLADHLFMVPVYHTFGSEELSAQAPAIAQLTPEPYLILNVTDALELKLEEGQHLTFKIGELMYHLPIKISMTITRGTAGLPVGLPGVPFAELPGWAILNKDLIWKQKPQAIS